MSKKISTKYAIGDLVYLASEESIDRDIIKAIKIVGLKHQISYGIKQSRDYFSLYFFGSDRYNWYKSSDIFATQEDAEHRQADLKAKAEARAKQEELREIAEMEENLERDKENLRRKKKGLPLLGDDED